MTINYSIDELIPQKHPFLLVDKLTGCDGEKFESCFQIPVNHPLVTHGVLTEGGLLENIAQTSAAGNGFNARSRNFDIPKGFIAGIKNFKVTRLPLCKSKIYTIVRVNDFVMGFSLISGEVRENNELIASCEMKIYSPL